MIECKIKMGQLFIIHTNTLNDEWKKAILKWSNTGYIKLSQISLVGTQSEKKNKFNSSHGKNKF
jgi:hypothetical protein